MDKLQNTIKKKFFCLITFSVLLFLSIGTVSHASEKYIVTVTLSTNNGTTGIQGAELSFEQIASATKTEDGYDYLLLDDYKDTEVNPNKITDKKRDEIIQKLLLQGSGNKISGSTNKDGKVTFSASDPGIYMVWESNHAGESFAYQDIQPRLVYLPSYNNATKTWDKDLEINISMAQSIETNNAYKAESERQYSRNKNNSIIQTDKKSLPDQPQNTHDRHKQWSVFLVIGIIVICLIGSFLFLPKGQKRNDKIDEG